MFYESGTSSHSQAASFCLLLHDTCRNKRSTERKRERCKRKSYLNLELHSRREPPQTRQILWNRRNMLLIHNTEIWHTWKPGRQSWGRTLRSKEDLNICSCLAKALLLYRSGDLMVIKANQLVSNTKWNGEIISANKLHHGQILYRLSVCTEWVTVI